MSGPLMRPSMGSSRCLYRPFPGTSSRRSFHLTAPRYAEEPEKGQSLKAAMLTPTRAARASSAAAAQQVQALYGGSSPRPGAPIDLRAQAASSPARPQQQLIRRSPAGPGRQQEIRRDAPSGARPSGPIVRRVDRADAASSRGGFNRGGRGGLGQGGRGGRGGRAGRGRRRRGASGEEDADGDEASLDLASSMPGRFLEAALAQPAVHPAPVTYTPVAPTREELVGERTATMARPDGAMQMLGQRIGLAAGRMRNDWLLRDWLAQRFVRGEVVRFADDGEREKVMGLVDKMEERKIQKIEERTGKVREKDDLTFEPVHEGLRKQLMDSVVKGQYSLAPEESEKTWDERLVRTVERGLAMNGSYVATDGEGVIKKVKSLIAMQPNRGARPAAR